MGALTFYIYAQMPAQTLFLLIVAFVWLGLALIIFRFGPIKAFARFVFWSAIVLAASAQAALMGFLSHFNSFPPPIPLVALPGILLAIFGVLGFNSQFARKALPLATMLQLFRLGVEVVFLMLYRDGKLPQQMTLEGINFEIISGLLALPTAAALLWLPWRTAQIIGKAYNFIGFVLLLTAVAIAVTSTPGVLNQFPTPPYNTLVGQMPYVWLPAFLVPAALFLHLISFKGLSARKPWWAE